MALFRPHIPILNEVKEKGPVQTFKDRIDDAVTRVTAGLSIGDIRSVLRDDTPSRPNPRLKPHVESFWLHMKPTYYHKLVDGIYPTFRLGWLSTFFFALEIVTGVFLMVFYTPSPLVAYENMLNILSNVPFGQLMRDIHRLEAEIMVLVVMLHMLRTFVTGSYKKPRRFTWATGVILLIITWVLSFSGYLLPWDQLSLWAVTIGVSMVEAVPPEVVGRTLNLLARGGLEFGATGLLRWYLLHVIALPLIGIVFLGVHFYKVVLQGHSLPPDAEEVGEDTARRVPIKERVYFMPKILTRELAWVVALLAIMIGATAFAWGYPAPLEPHADPLVTPLHTTAPWYFLWVQGMLKLGDKILWGVIVPTVLIGGLLVLPYIEVGPSRRYGDRRIGLSAAALTVVGFAILSFMGTPWYAVSTSPEQEAIAVMVPQTNPGPLREAPWDELELGSYESSDWQAAPTPALQELLHQFDEEIEHVASSEVYENPEGIIVVQSWQPGLKKITLRVIWENSETGEPSEVSQRVYLHRDSGYRAES